VKRFPFFSVLIVVSFSVWFVWASLLPELPQEGEPPRLYSNQCRQDLTLTFLGAIEEAKKSVHLVMFGLSDPAILASLSKKITDHVPTTIYYDPSASPNIRKSLKSENVHPIRMPGLMHQKILILDDERVFLGSANMTTPSLKMHDNLVIGLDDKKIARFLKESAPLTPGHLRSYVGGQDVDLWLLPDSKGHALAELKKMLRSARKSIRVALFTFTHPVLLDELAAAHKRGIAVTLVVDMHSGLGASARSIEMLRRSGVRILLSQGVQLLHHKFVYIDDKTLAAGSANWTKAAFTNNSDCLVILHNLNESQKKFMNLLWRRIETNAKIKS
jgi:phosphatidylserine/phosphatidylglycerophosphate/cardiolipin synthase-like enzyme